uniref:Uncharacterized protein n=1 Tax=Steinernema glaseri TaxID=37863 RepID=A0A1I7ZW98_9BILA
MWLFPAIAILLLSILE